MSGSLRISRRKANLSGVVVRELVGLLVAVRVSVGVVLAGAEGLESIDVSLFAGEDFSTTRARTLVAMEFSSPYGLDPCLLRSRWKVWRMLVL